MTNNGPVWTEKDPNYLRIDVNQDVLSDYIYTWSNPDRTDTCPK